ncbi:MULTISPECIES: sigma-54 interaction domain-containing protein [unclassified Citrobacter]|uniref:sigma-54 interaction domain-containing protein n=1 Tax=unclassified Citrobacter TaxID=2644389 RepID=UPI00107CFDD4|nr:MULTISPECIES: sigma 54-interacting transcriptional regulator [unclassified Citrobacter]EKU7606707.1 sigma 54-interacting transcriptional regulator [Citrobacter freundii]MBJ3559346.1 sigma 54-interacting transcriptional regulator [Salmonella enterica subsp. enterica serovar Derby]MBJ4954561.1 sigma 54-interacting transcriptional regulator [Salmonella enterica subsp. enterica serovar Goldcoast]MBA7965364.1 sigma 54-interacting transcriptional regulator [Citrobacter sp. RHBSTW-00671]MDA8510891
MVTIRWDIKTIDRLSMVEDVLKEFSCCDINIISMKVTPGRILIKSWCRQLQDISCVQSCLSQRADIINVAYLCEEISELSMSEPERPRYFSDIICSSQSMQLLIEKAIRIADSKYTVLVRGETGTGKELLARAIHNSGSRRFYPFIPVNCSALPESLMESEFFGYEKGAFSGADCKGKKGLFEMADKGTLFLDEFGEMSLSLQAKLLRVLQDGGIRRVGGAQTIPVNARIIVATNANLEEMVEQRLLRADLYYRINVLSLTIPPLRERPQDISLLIRHFVQKYAKEFQRRIILDKACFDALHQHSWPGNVRELENTIIRLMLMAESDVITREDLGMANLSAGELRHTQRPFKEQVQCAERQLIEQMVEENVSSRHIAKALGVSHTTVLNKIRSYQLESVS